MQLSVGSPFLARFWRAVSDAWLELLAATVACTISELVVMALVAHSATQSLPAEDMSRLVFMFWSMVAILALSRYAVLRQAGLGTARVVHQFRCSLFEKLANCELPDLEKLGRSEVQLILGRDIATLSQPSNFIFSSLTTALNLLLVMLYLTYLNPLAGLCIGALQVLLFLWFYKRRRLVLAALRARGRAESALFQSLNSVILGFVELRLNALRRTQLVSGQMLDLSLRAKAGQEEVSRLQTQNFTSVDVFHYLTVGVPVFVLPSLGLLTGEVISQVTALVIFTMGAVPEIIINLTLMAQFDVATQRLEDLDKQLGREPADVGAPSNLRLRQVHSLEALQLDQLGYAYGEAGSESSFAVGPVDLQIRPGELLFIVGGNGSGKTTLLRTITGLYLPTSGCIRLNGVEIDRNNLDTYRSYFSAVFTDFHLFDRLFGVPDVTQEEVQALLQRLRLQHKTEYLNGAFSTLSLSTGQRKRLALLVALLENRPILVLDEVAADQDPEFRQFYYTVLLPELKAMGRTLLVVSHDDRYFHVADRVLRMDFGQVRSVGVTDNSPGPEAT